MRFSLIWCRRGRFFDWLARCEFGLVGSACLDVKEAAVASLTGLYDAMYPVPLVLSVQLERAGVEMLAMRTTMMKEATNASISWTTVF